MSDVERSQRFVGDDAGDHESHRNESAGATVDDSASPATDDQQFGQAIVDRGLMTPWEAFKMFFGRGEHKNEN